MKRLSTRGTLICLAIIALFQERAASGDWTLKSVDSQKLPGGIRCFEIQRSDGPAMTVYLGAFKSDPTERKPLILLLDGSGAQSLFAAIGDKVGTTGLLGLFGPEASLHYHVFAIEKRGVKFLENTHPGSAEGASQEYNEHATLEDRVAEARSLVDAVLKQEIVDPSRVVVIGHSEGADVAAALSAAEPRVTHCVCLSGAGATQIFDLMVLQRKARRRQGQSPEAAEKAVRQVEDEFRKILADPRSTDKMFAGHAYRRWASFVAVPPVEYLRKSRCKLFLAHGTEDESVPIESFDFAVSELIRCDRKDVTIRRYASRDHGFALPGADPSKPAMRGVYPDIAAWLNGKEQAD
jgi:pimeloyl-ACP methyl ester carboxylesterase